MRELTYREALREALREELNRDKGVFMLGEDIAEYSGVYKVTQGFLEEFGKDRIRNTNLAEAAIAGAALGASLVGTRPVAEIQYIDFSLIALDQVFNQIAKFRYMTGGMVKVPLVLRTQGGGYRSAGLHHSQSLESLYTHIPGLTVIMPATPYDAKGLLKASIRDDNPIIFIEHKDLYNESGPVPEEEYLLPIGKGDIKRQGNDITVVAYSKCLLLALKAADILDKHGISLEVVDPRTLRPLDEEIILTSVKKTSRLLIVHEACRTGGFGAEIAAIVAEKCIDYLDAPIIRVTALDSPIPFNPKLERHVLPSEDKIVKAAFKVMGKEAPAEMAG